MTSALCQSETSALDLGVAASTLKPDIPAPGEKGLDLATRITEGIEAGTAATPRRLVHMWTAPDLQGLVGLR